MKTLISIVVAGLILTVFFDYSLNHKISFLGFAPQTATGASAPVPYGKAIGSLAAMLVGIIFGSIYEGVRGLEGKVNIGSEIMKVISSAHFYKALLVAPLVFAGIYTAAKAQPDEFVATLFAFQNGFFCHSIFLGRKREQGSR